MFPPIFNYKRVPLDELQRINDNDYCTDGNDFQMFDSTLGSIAQHTAEDFEKLDQPQQNQTNRHFLFTQREFPDVAINEPTNNPQNFLKDPREDFAFQKNSVTQRWNARNVGLRGTAIRGRLGTSVAGKLAAATQMKSSTSIRGKTAGMIRGNLTTTKTTSRFRGTNTRGKSAETIREKLLHSRYQTTETSVASNEEDITEVS